MMPMGETKIISSDKISKEYMNYFVGHKAMQRFEWHNIIKESYGLKPFYVIAVKDTEYAVIGSFETVKGYISMPFLSHSGFESNSYNLLSDLKTYLTTNNINIDARNVIPLEQNPSYVTSVIALESMDSYWRSLSTNMRNQIRKSQAFGFETTYLRNMSDDAYDLYARAMHRLGTPVHKKLFFDKILEYIPESFVLTVSDESKSVGFMLCVYDGDILYDLFAATNPEYNPKYANYFLYYEAITKAFEIGLKYFDMGRSTYGSTVHQFKQKWKPRDYSIASLIRYQKSGSFGLLSKIWQKLPYRLTLWLGPKVRKYLP